MIWYIVITVPYCLFSDCHDIYKLGYTVSGVYPIRPVGSPQLDDVYCHLINQSGWTVFQRRIDGSTNFNRRWLEYKYGFGNPYGEFWLGNEMLHRLTRQGDYLLRIDIWDWEGNRAYAEYSHFKIHNEKHQYKIIVGGYHGNAGDSLSVHDSMSFSTEDVDNDHHRRHCAVDNKSGWWFNSCFYSNLNGVYHMGWYNTQTSLYANSVSNGIVWYTWKDSEFYSLKKIEMKIKPVGLRARSN